MSRGRSTREQAASGELGALRWSLLQNTDDAGANHLLIIMAWRANASFACHMSVATMAALVRCHPRTIQHRVQYLLKREFITDISDQYPERRTRTYRLNAPTVML